MEKIKNAFIKVKDFIVKFFGAIGFVFTAIVLPVILYNRRTAKHNRNDVERTRQSDKRLQDRAEQCSEDYRRAAEIIKQVRNTDKSIKDNNSSSSSK